MKPENSINYYYAVQALRLLVERGLLSETEYDKASRYCAGIFQPEAQEEEILENSGSWTATAVSSRRAARPSSSSPSGR